MKITFVVAVLLFSVAGFAQSPLTADSVYAKNCAKCHGKTAEGRHFGGPSLVETKLSLEDLKNIITNGKGHMPKFQGKLTDEQITALATEIKDLGPKQHAKP